MEALTRQCDELRAAAAKGEEAGSTAGRTIEVGRSSAGRRLHFCRNHCTLYRYTHPSNPNPHHRRINRRPGALVQDHRVRGGADQGQGGGRPGGGRGDRGDQAGVREAGGLIL
jgi:hypothetical protein